MNKKVVFDVDDILWGLNKRSAKIAGIDYNKLTVYSASDNYNLTDSEKEKLISAYSSPSTFEEIKWYRGIEELPKLEELGAEVYINSNSFNAEIAELKREQLKSVLDFDDDRFILNIISDCKKKDIGDDVFCFVDDSPYNIKRSTAKYNIMIKLPWNSSESAKEIIGDKDVIMADNLEEVIELVNNLLKSA